MRVKEIMTSAVTSVPPSTRASAAGQLMKAEHIHHLVVKDGERLVGVFSQSGGAYLGTVSGSIVDAIGSVAVAFGGAYFLWMGVRAARRRLLWRVRRKLIISYIFIGFIPALLIIAFFLLGGFLLMNLLVLLEGADRLSLKRDLEVAREIQNAMLPNGTWAGPSVEAFGMTKPANTVGGISTTSSRSRMGPCWSRSVTWRAGQPGRVADGVVASHPADARRRAARNGGRRVR